jgi:hypothetical protein
MEALFRKIEEEDGMVKVGDYPRDDVSQALARFAEALRQVLPILEEETKDDEGDNIDAKWLLSLCEKIPSALGPSQLARAVLDASGLTDEGRKQEALFAALGASEEAMDVLFQIAPHLPKIKESISLSDLGEDPGLRLEAQAELVDESEMQRQRLRQEALDAAQVAAIAQAEAEAMMGPSRSGSTHTITRSSDLDAQKTARKAAKRAAQALQRAKAAGAIIEDSDLLAVDASIMGSGGLMRRNEDELRALQQSLQPEGSRKYYNDQGLPDGTIREDNADIGYERVIIPAPVLDVAKLHPRLNINDILDSDCARAFAGTASLNPMQSAVFDTAFNRRENVLVCAPTGAGTCSLSFGL